MSFELLRTNYTSKLINHNSRREEGHVSGAFCIGGSGEGAAAAGAVVVFDARYAAARRDIRWALCGGDRKIRVCGWRTGRVRRTDYHRRLHAFAGGGAWYQPGGGAGD